MKPIALYPTTVHRAQMMSETGTRYTLLPWTTDTDRIKGESGEPDRVLVLADDVMLYVSVLDDLIADRPRRSGALVVGPIELSNLITLQGTIIDATWGHTRVLTPGEDYTTAADLLATL